MQHNHYNDLEILQGYARDIIALGRNRTQEDSAKIVRLAIAITTIATDIAQDTMTEVITLDHGY